MAIEGLEEFHPGFEIGGFLEKYYGVADASLLPNRLMAMPAATGLSNEEMGMSATFDRASVEAVHYDLRVSGRLRKDLHPYTAFRRRFDELIDTRSQAAEVPWRISHRDLSAPTAAPAKQRRFERAVAEEFAGVLGLVNNSEVLSESTYSVVRNPANGVRTMHSQKSGMEVPFPSGDGQVLMYSTGILNSLELASSLAAGGIESIVSISDNQFLSHILRVMAKQKGVGGKVDVREGNIGSETDRLHQDMAYRQAEYGAGFDAIFMLNTGNLAFNGLSTAITKARNMLRAGGFLALSGWFMPLAGRVGIGEVADLAQDAFESEPQQQRDLAIEDFRGAVNRGRELVFVKE